MGKFAIPGAIIVAGLLIAGAVWVSMQSSNTSPQPNTGDVDTSVVLPITEDDHVLGNPNAPIIIVEYSDIDCPFCKQYHEVMKQVIDEYGPSGEVAWVYRHFPITQIHPDARKHAIAAECVAREGGNDAFWDFLDILFVNAPGSERTNPARYAEFAAQVGVSEAELNTCMADPSVDAHVQSEIEVALEAGATGTPFNVIVVDGEEPVALAGSVPYNTMKNIIDQILQQRRALGQ